MIGGLSTNLNGTARVSGRIHAIADPPLGKGPVPAPIEISFEAGHLPVMVGSAARRCLGAARVE